MTKFYLTVKIDMKLSKANCIPCDPVSLPSNVAKNRDFHLSPGDINPFVCSEVKCIFCFKLNGEFLSRHELRSFFRHLSSILFVFYS